MNGYSTYFNKVVERKGSLWEGSFRVVRVTSGEQLVHVSRYIHINPYVGFVVKKERLFSFPWSSLPVYLGSGEFEWKFVEVGEVLENFSSKKEYTKFLLNEADFKRSQKDFGYLFVE